MGYNLTSSNSNSILGKQKLALWMGIYLSICMFTACKPQLLFQRVNPEDAPKYYPELNSIYEHTLNSDDKLTVSVWGHEDLGVGSAFGLVSSSEDLGKYITINEQGEITLPLVGDVKVAGLTVREANLYLRKLYTEFLNDPIVYLRVINYQVTIMGEVKSPGNYKIDRQRKSLLEAIAAAGGFSEYADKAHITVLRKNDAGITEEVILDLTDIETLNRSSLTLENRDLVYVPERGAKQANKIFSGLVVPVLGLLGGISLFYSSVIKP